MAMRTASPWWLSLWYGVGLLSLLLGERVLDQNSLHWLLTGLGVALVVATTGLRAWTTLGTRDARRRVERTLLGTQLAGIVGILLYALSTDWGLAKLGLAETTAGHVHGALTVLMAICFLIAVVPAGMIELGLGTALRDRFELAQSAEDEGVEYLRVRDIGWSGLSVALAASLLMVTCRVASERNISKDVSYFKTSSPGDSTKQIVEHSGDPFSVYLFFPPTNEVADQVKGYFEELADATGKVQVEEKSKLVDKDIAEKYKADDGSVVIVRGKDKDEKFQTIKLDTEIDKARKASGKLRNLDKEVKTALLKIAHDKRKAYFIAGHGEMTDPDTIPGETKKKIKWPRSVAALKKKIGELNYEIKDLAQADLMKDVPADATMVMLFAPSLKLLDQEWDALTRYIDKGGRVLLAFDPNTNTDADMGPLAGKLGVKFQPGVLTDDAAHFPISHTVYDKRFIGTSAFSAHASTTSLSRTSKALLALIESGTLVDEKYTGKGEAPKKTYTIRTLDSSYVDLNNDFAFNADSEKKDKYNVAAAIEGPKVDNKDGFRVLVFADVDLFADADWVVSRPTGSTIGGPLIEDSVHWLGGEEAFIGETVSEDDKPIQHTKGQQDVWFTLMIVGGPLVVLVLGLLGTWARRKRAKKQIVEVTP